MDSSKEEVFAHHVDDVLTRFATERLQYTSDSFRKRFISYIYINYAESNRQHFLKTASKMAGINVKIHEFFRNPFKNGESFLFFMIFSVLVMALFCLAGNQPHLGLILISGAIVHTIAVVRKLSDDFRENDVRMHIYEDMKEIIDSELEKR